MKKATTVGFLVLFVLCTTASGDGQEPTRMPPVLQESAGLVGELSSTTTAIEALLNTITPGEWQTSYSEGRSMDISVALIRLHLRKLKERADGFSDPILHQHRFSLLVHILTDLHEIRYGLRNLQELLDFCLSCDEDGRKETAARAMDATAVIEATETAAGALKESLAGAVHKLTGEWERCSERQRETTP